MDAGLESPETRRFKRHPVSMVMADRSKYISAILTLARAYDVAGRPLHDSTGPWAGFEAWCVRVREPLMWAGAEDPVKSQQLVKDHEPERGAVLDFMYQWHATLGSGGMFRVNEIIETANTRTNMGTDDVPRWAYVFPEFRTALTSSRACKDGYRIDPRLLGEWLSAIKDRPFDGFKIELAQRDKSNGNKWRLVETEPHPPPPI
jgi:putative DNA primase/helicase